MRVRRRLHATKAITSPAEYHGLQLHGVGKSSGPLHTNFIAHFDNTGGSPEFDAINPASGCISQGDTLKEAYEMIMEAKASWVESALLEKEVIPEPSDEKKYSGKILLRIPPKQHMELAEEAHRQGVHRALREGRP